VDKIEILEEKIRAAVLRIEQLRESHAKLALQHKKLQQENELLHSENLQVRKLVGELDRLRDERKIIKQKCEKLVFKFDRMKL